MRKWNIVCPKTGFLGVIHARTIRDADVIANKYWPMVRIFRISTM